MPDDLVVQRMAVRLGRRPRPQRGRVQGAGRRDHREAVVRQGTAKPVPDEKRQCADKRNQSADKSQSTDKKGAGTMSRKVADCRDFPSEIGCTLTISGEQDEVIVAAVQHAAAVHGHQDNDELRAWLKENLKDEVPV